MADLFAAAYNPDVLSCLANLSNDEVFTPPELANQVLDMLPEELWSDSSATFLDPCCKSGVFLREIAKRLIKGLEDEIPDLQERLDHIYHKQLFGVAITELTSLLSRRSLYCSKFPNGKYSVCTFDTYEGNVRFRECQHTWDGGRCKYCGASKKELGEGREGLETHAYEFIHLTKPEELFDMKFDVIVGNPPYQLSDGGGNGASSVPIYQKFVEQAKKLNPRYLVMITPSRWFSGGKGLDAYRNEMLEDGRIRVIHDYPVATDCFEGVQIKGGVSYFLWCRDNPGDCAVFNHWSDHIDGPVIRPLLENGADTFIRFSNALPILHKVASYKENSFEEHVSARLPFGLPNTFKGTKTKQSEDDLVVYVSGNDRDLRGSKAYVPAGAITKGQELINREKVFIAKAGSGSDTFPHQILPQPFYGEKGTVCNESYLVIGPYSSKMECRNVMSYIATKFFRFMVLLRKSTQNAAKGVYRYVPMQDFSKPWTDEELYAKYGLTDEEIAFIESMIKPMDLGGTDA